MNTPTQTQGGESATPRTDELLIDCLNSNRFRVEHMADFARQLERETATLHAQLKEARNGWDKQSFDAQGLELLVNDLTAENAQQAAQIARLKQREGELVEMLKHGTALMPVLDNNGIRPMSLDWVSAARAVLKSVAKEGDQSAARTQETTQ